IGVDSSRQDAIEDCTTRDYCRRSLGLLRNGRAGVFDPPYVLNPAGNPGAGRGTDIFFPGQPEWLPTEGHRFTVTTRGVIRGDGYATPGVIGDSADPNWDLGWYEFNEAGNDIVPYLADLTPEQLAAVNSVGVQVGAFAAGSAWATPYGRGKGIYEDQPIRPRQERDNLFTRFSYDLEGGIRLSADLTYGRTEAET